MYLDKAEKTATKGLNDEFGFYINRPFYFVSELPFNRVIEMLGGTNMVLKRWRVVYVDTVKAKTKGLNEEFGFVINRPFYMVSRLPMNRVMESPGANNIQLKRWRKNAKSQ
jgi:hypothetical protein